MYWFKPLMFVVTCYTAIENEYTTASGSRCQRPTWMEGGKRLLFSIYRTVGYRDEGKKGSFPRHISSFFKGCVWCSLWEDFNAPDPHLAPAPLVTPRSPSSCPVATWLWFADLPYQVNSQLCGGSLSFYICKMDPKDVVRIT